MSNVSTTQWLENMKDLYRGAASEDNFTTCLHIESMLEINGFTKEAKHLREEYPIERFVDSDKELTSDDKRV